ncbi:hypothetical protein [Halorarius litoreus]|uniref:hypothetical protein n=1 Tax=Halorarius litoreus TaxID=2962676 RepID=UPI0020CF7E8B|nr:hypothetical protein [Halorarius litoreus]
MSLRSYLSTVPRLLLVEAALAGVVLLTGVLPLALFNYTPVSPPPGFSVAWLVLPLLALALLWLLLLLHVGVDAIRVVRRYDSYDLGDSATRINSAFRLLATLGAVSAPVFPLLLFDTDGPVPQAGFAIVLVGVVALPVLASGLVVLAHVAWLVSDTDEPTTTA